MKNKAYADQNLPLLNLILRFGRKPSLLYRYFYQNKVSGRPTHLYDASDRRYASRFFPGYTPWMI